MVEIVDHFHMIGDEGDRHDDEVLDPLGGRISSRRPPMSGSMPGLRRRSAAALVRDMKSLRPTASETSRDDSRSCSSYLQLAAMEFGMLWAVKTSFAAARRSGRFGR